MSLDLRDGLRERAEELARLNASLRMLNEISVDLLGDIPLNRLLELILEKTFTFLQPDRGLLMLADDADLRARCSANAWEAADGTWGVAVRMCVGVCAGRCVCAIA